MTSLHGSITGFTEKDMAEHTHLVQRLTSFRQCCCCNICKDVDDDAFKVVAKELHQYFSGWDVVVTDIMAGLVLTAQLQAESRMQIRVHSSKHVLNKDPEQPAPPSESGKRGGADAEHSKALQKTAEADSVMRALDDEEEEEVDVVITPEWAKDADAQLSTLEEGLQRHVTNQVLSKHVSSFVAPKGSCRPALRSVSTGLLTFLGPSDRFRLMWTLWSVHKQSDVACDLWICSDRLL